jgi:hypothetical protein
MNEEVQGIRIGLSQNVQNFEKIEMGYAGNQFLHSGQLSSRINS